MKNCTKMTLLRTAVLTYCVNMSGSLVSCRVVKTLASAPPHSKKDVINDNCPVEPRRNVLTICDICLKENINSYNPSAIYPADYDNRDRGGLEIREKL